MVHKAIGILAAGPQRHLQGVEREIAAKRAGHPPTDDPPGEYVGDEGDVDEPVPGGYIGNVGDPELVRACRPEVAIHEVRRPDRMAVGSRRDLEGAPADAAEPQVAHEARDRAAGDGDPLATELQPYLARSVDAEVVAVHASDFGL
jgi:hypothetical protein